VTRLRIDLAYDGGGFHGFARQPDTRTVQGVLEDALWRCWRRKQDEPVTTTVAGRTDAGVHAECQTVHVDAPPGDIDTARLRRALDRLCGHEITIWDVRTVPDDFDARFDAVRRRYRYRLCDDDAMDPHWRHTTWHVGPPPLDVDAMTTGGRQLLGEHDFSSFCRRSGDQHLRRRLDVLEVERTADGAVAVQVHGPAFCHQMVRSIVGCLVPVGRGRRAPDEVGRILRTRDRAAVGQVAPPHGLTLVGVDY
jgi:tRNA pseudouridine38-40 synthase